MPLVEGTNVFRFAVDKIDAAASAFGVKVKEKQLLLLKN